MQENNQPNVKKILLDLADHAHVKGIRGLAEFLEIRESRLYSWIGRGRIGDTGSILSKLPNVRLDWLKTGEGPMLALSGSRKEQFQTILLIDEPELSLHHQTLLKLFDAVDPQTQDEVLTMLFKKSRRKF